MSLRVLVNGESRELSDSATVETLVRALSTAPEGRGVAVAVEGHVVRRAEWATTELANGAHVEVVAAVQGG
ncbi:MAG: sulfur carrier protein ThiS [Solirubrobacterales bacterium]|nr:sulfur carrier protein ThiS [Solirubrobacterales bacterium]